MSVGVVVMTYNAEKHLPHCLPPLLNSPIRPRVLVVNSSSPDNTVALAKKMGAETLLIPRKEMNHGLTREKARKSLNTDIVVMITQDAYLTTTASLETLIQPILKKQTAISYGKQLPHDGAQFFESFPREFNYPPNSHIRGVEDLKEYGAYTFFCSNSFAAWSNSALNSIGGFEEVLMGEDTIACAKLLLKGEKIAYVSEATAKHSHHYSLAQEFQRHFDTGLARQMHRDLFSQVASAENRGWHYLQEMCKQLFKKHPQKIPYAFLHILSKWLGYQIGKRSLQAPNRWKRMLSSQDFYWNSSYAVRRARGR